MDAYGGTYAERDLCEKWIQDGSGIKWMEDLSKCIASKCPYDRPINAYKKYYDAYWQDVNGSRRPNMTQQHVVSFY